MSLPPRTPSIPRGRRAIQPPPRAARAVSTVMGQFSKRFGAGFNDIAARWSEIVGERTARMCTPVKLTGRGAEGVLHLAAVGPAALLVEADSERIKVAVNRYCGRDVVRRIALTRAPARPAQAADALARPRSLPPTTKLRLEAQLAPVADPGLKAALMKLGRAMLSAGPGGDGGRTPRERTKQ